MWVYRPHLTPRYLDVGLDPGKDGLRNEKDLDDDGMAYTTWMIIAS